MIRSTRQPIEAADGLAGGRSPIGTASRRWCRRARTRSSPSPSTRRTHQPVTRQDRAARARRSPGVRRGFRRHCELAAALTHPNIASVLDWGQVDLPDRRDQDGRRGSGSASTSPGAACATCSIVAGRSNRRRRSSSDSRRAGRSTSPTSAASCTPRSPRRSSCSATTGGCGSSTSDSPNCSAPTPGRTRPTCRPTSPATPRPSRRSAWRSTPRPTCTRCRCR